MSYAWEIVDSAFTSEMQIGLKKDPSLVGKLRATFLKVILSLDFLIFEILLIGPYRNLDVGGGRGSNSPFLPIKISMNLFKNCIISSA